jgi:hypothetical protein
LSLKGDIWTKGAFMALDIYRLDNDEHMFGLENDGLYIIFEKFRKRTGIDFQ